MGNQGETLNGHPWATCCEQSITFVDLLCSQLLEWGMMQLARGSIYAMNARMQNHWLPRQAAEQCAPIAYTFPGTYLFTTIVLTGVCTTGSADPTDLGIASSQGIVLCTALHSSTHALQLPTHLPLATKTDQLHCLPVLLFFKPVRPYANMHPTSKSLLHVNSRYLVLAQLICSTALLQAIPDMTSGTAHEEQSRHATRHTT